MRSPGPELPCCKCGEHFNWMYNEVCPKCKTDSEATLDTYYTHMRVVEKQYEDHSIDEDEIWSDFPVLPELDDAQEEYEKSLYKLYSY